MKHFVSGSYIVVNGINSKDCNEIDTGPYKGTACAVESNKNHESYKFHNKLYACCEMNIFVRKFLNIIIYPTILEF